MHCVNVGIKKKINKKYTVQYEQASFGRCLRAFHTFKGPKMTVQLLHALTKFFIDSGNVTTPTMAHRTCAKATQLRRSSPIVLRSRVFSLLKALNDHSASQEETGTTKTTLTTFSVSVKYGRVDKCTFSRSAAATPLIHLKLQYSQCNKSTRDTTSLIPTLFYICF